MERVSHGVSEKTDLAWAAVDNMILNSMINASSFSAWTHIYFKLEKWKIRSSQKKKVNGYYETCLSARHSLSSSEVNVLRQDCFHHKINSAADKFTVGAQCYETYSKAKVN